MKPDKFGFALHGRVLHSNVPRVMVLKNVSTVSLKLLYSSGSNLDHFWNTELAVDFADEVALQASNNLAFTFPILCAFLDISKRRFVAVHPDDGDTVECIVRLSVSASVEADAVRFPTGCRDRTNATEFGKWAQTGCAWE
jgi:hypothetical protein